MLGLPIPSVLPCSVQSITSTLSSMDSLSILVQLALNTYTSCPAATFPSHWPSRRTSMIALLQPLDFPLCSEIIVISLTCVTPAVTATPLLPQRNIDIMPLCKTHLSLRLVVPTPCHCYRTSRRLTTPLLSQALGRYCCPTGRNPYL